MNKYFKVFKKIIKILNILMYKLFQKKYINVYFTIIYF